MSGAALLDPAGQIAEAFVPAHGVPVAADEQVELAAAHAQAPGGLHPVAVGPPQGLVQEVALERVHFGAGGAVRGYVKSNQLLGASMVVKF